MIRSIYFILLILFPFVAMSQQTPDGSLTRAGQQAPVFSFELERGKMISLSDYKGKIVLINFFATWCPPCRAEFPRVQNEIWNKYKDNNNFVLLAFAREETWDTVTKFKQGNAFTFSILPDEGRKIFSLYATQSIPRNVIIDGEGTIIYQSIGYSPEEFEKMLQLLASRLGS